MRFQVEKKYINNKTTCKCKPVDNMFKKREQEN